MAVSMPRCPWPWNGNLIENFYLDFQNGKIVGVHAETGEEYLRAATQVDEGASYLGEVALVPYDSPIQQYRAAVLQHPVRRERLLSSGLWFRLSQLRSRAARNWMQKVRRHWA